MALSLCQLYLMDVYEYVRRCKNAMAFVPTPNTVKVCLRYLQNGQNTCNIFHVDCGEEPTPTLLNTVAAVFFNWWNVTQKLNINTATSLQAIEVTDVSSPSDDGIVYTTDLPMAGTLGGDPMPNNVTVAVKKATGFTGRSRRGRTYIAGLSESSLASGRQSITSTAQSAFQDSFALLRDQLLAAGFTWVVNSLVTGGAPRTEGLNTAITDIFVDVVLDAMRRRLPGRGT